MAGIILRAGDFGQGSEVTLTAEALYLPNAAAPDGRERVEFADIAEVEDVAEDAADSAKPATSVGLASAALLGPVSLTAGLLGSRKTKDEQFLVRLTDARHFVAVTDAKTYGDLRQRWLGARKAVVIGAGPDDDDDEVRDQAIDRILAKYIDAAQPTPAPTPTPAPALAQAAATTPTPQVPFEAKPGVPPPPMVERRATPQPGAKPRPAPVFGRRRTDQ